MTSDSDSPHSHWSQCVMHARAYARKIAQTRNPETLLAAYLNAPAFYPEWRKELGRIGLEYIQEANQK